MVDRVHWQLLQKQATTTLASPDPLSKPTPKPAPLSAPMPAIADTPAAALDEEGIDGEPLSEDEVQSRAREIDPAALWGGEEEVDPEWEAWNSQGPWEIGVSGWTEEEWDAWAEAWDPEEEKAQATLAAKAEARTSRPVATPTHTEGTPVPALRRLPSNSNLSVASDATTLVMGAPPPPDMPPLDECPTAAAIVNSTTHKREYMRLVSYSAL